jgi:hypothetical protein
LQASNIGGICTIKIRSPSSRACTCRAISWRIEAGCAPQVAVDAKIRDERISKPSKARLVAGVIALPHSYGCVHQARIALGGESPIAASAGPVALPSDDDELFESPLGRCVCFVVSNVPREGDLRYIVIVSDGETIPVLTS